MFVCIATTSARHVSSEKQVGTWNLKCQASCALDSLLLPNNVRYYDYSMHRFNFDEPIGHPRLFISLSCLPLNHMGSYAIALYGFGLIFYIHVPVIMLFYLCSCQDHYIIVNWNMELNLRNTCHHKGGMGPLG
jgi:hypothetical protein